MTERRRIVIADDHPPTRGQIRETLERHGFDVCGEAPNASMAIKRAVDEQPDVCLLDVHMPGSGIRACAQITARLPDTAVVMLTVSSDDADLFDALRAGAAGYLLKGGELDRLPGALESVLRGEPTLGPGLLAKLVDEFRERSRRRRLPVVGGRTVNLTSREWEILDLLRQGLSTRQVAERLFVAPVTVRSHVAAILRKLQVPDRESAIHLRDEAER